MKWLRTIHISGIPLTLWVSCLWKDLALFTFVLLINGCVYGLMAYELVTIPEKSFGVGDSILLVLTVLMVGVIIRNISYHIVLIKRTYGEVMLADVMKRTIELGDAMIEDLKSKIESESDPEIKKHMSESLIRIQEVQVRGKKIEIQIEVGSSNVDLN